MPKILSVATHNPPFEYDQEEMLALARQLFGPSFQDIDRLLQVFHNGQIKRRYLSAPLDWFTQARGLQEKNERYIELAVELSVACIQECLKSAEYLKREIPYEQIDALIYISSSGIATPSIEARVMNRLPFHPQTKRIPIWGLGCAGGAAGLARAYDYCLAYPEAMVLVLSVELCSLTFLHQDHSKSNLIGSSLFSDGAACALVGGRQSGLEAWQNQTVIPRILGTQSNLLPHSEEVMGWNVIDEGLQVVFSKDIPSIVLKWFRPNLDSFLQRFGLSSDLIRHFIAHPGGKKVLEAYQQALNFSDDMIEESLAVLQRYGNMSSATVLFVLDQFMKKEISSSELGLITSLGPGFSSEFLLVEWAAN